MKRKKISSYILGFLLGYSVILFCSCKKFVQIPSPPGLIVTSQVFADSADAVSGVIGIYTYVESSVYSFGIGNGLVTICGGLSSDELHSGSVNTTETEIYSNNVTPGNSDILTLWSEAYTAIYQANACIEG